MIQTRLTASGCISHTGIDYQRNGAVFDVQMQTVDHCLPGMTHFEQTLDIGQLPAGTYTVNYHSCGLTPPGTPSCSLSHSEQLIIRAASRATAQTVAGSSIWALSGLALLLIGLAAPALQRRF